MTTKVDIFSNLQVRNSPDQHDEQQPSFMFGMCELKWTETR